MAGNLNKVLMIGRLGKDPDLRYTSGGTAVATASLATNRWRDGKKSTDWHPLVVWGDRGEEFAGACSKGTLVRVEGALERRRWKPEKGGEREVAEINVREWENLDDQANQADDREGPPPPGDGD